MNFRVSKVILYLLLKMLIKHNLAVQIEFFSESTDLTLRSDGLQPGCRSLPVQMWNTTFTIQSDVCIFLYPDPLCELKGSRMYPGLRVISPEYKNGTVKAYVQCSEKVTIANPKIPNGGKVRLHLSAKCISLSFHYFAPSLEVHSGACVKLYARPKCEGTSVKLLPPHSHGVNLTEFSYRKCDDIAIKFYNNTKYEGRVTSDCHSLSPSLPTSFQQIRTDKCAVIYSNPNCSGKSYKLQAGLEANSETLLAGDISINSYRSCDEILDTYHYTNFEGSFTRYNLEADCANFLQRDWKSISSIQNEVCITVYTETGCIGRSRDIWPGTGNDLGDLNNEVISYRRCQQVHFYVGLDFKGVLYEDTLNHGCKTLPPEFWNQTGSIKVDSAKEASCLELFSLPDCTGKGSKINSADSGKNLQSQLEGVVSFAKCDPQIYTFLDSPVQLKPVGRIETYCKEIHSSLDDYQYNSYVLVDVCTNFFDNSDCGGEPFVIREGMGVELPSNQYNWFQSCQKRITLLDPQTEIKKTTVGIDAKNYSAEEIKSETLFGESEEPQNDSEYSIPSTPDDQHNESVEASDVSDIHNRETVNSTPTESTPVLDKRESVQVGVLKGTPIVNLWSHGQPTANDKTAPYVIIGSIFSILSVVAVIITYRLVKQNRRAHRNDLKFVDSKMKKGGTLPIVEPLIHKQTQSCLNQTRMDTMVDQSHMDRLMDNSTDYESPSSSAIQVYSEDEVQLGCEIGKGAFGIVRKAQVHGFTLAAKQISRDYSALVEQERDTMSNFSHPHIVQLKGIVHINSGSSILLLELMEHGDLAKILRRSDPKKSKSGSWDNVIDNKVLDPERGVCRERSPDDLVLTYDSLLDVVSQVAEGMKYLSSHRFVHRDLAARNCLVSAQGIVKISDFGLTRDLYSTNCYNLQTDHHKKLPIRWMSPESISHGQYTLQSDVWSFGILLWEVYTWGMQPYIGYSNQEACLEIAKGMSPTPLPDCPQVVHLLMEECWNFCGDRRPNFFRICEKLQDASTSLKRRSDIRDFNGS